MVLIDSMNEMPDEGNQISGYEHEDSPEHIVLRQSEADMVQGLVASLPEKYRIPIYLYYMRQQR